VASQFLFSVCCSGSLFPQTLLQTTDGSQVSVCCCVYIIINGCTVKSAVNTMNIYAESFINTKVENSRQQQNRSSKTTNA
jgi:predicted metal-binding transcription factor (methanogenesis marker protein 9)